MRVIPRQVAGKIQFCASHLEPWTANAEALGFTPEQVADLQARTDAAREAYLAQRAAQAQAQAATLALKNAIAKMNKLASDMVQRIRVTAFKSNNDDVYSLGAIPAPKKKSKVAPPGQPSNFSMALDVSGRVMLKWDCKNPRGANGTIYRVWRRIGGAGAFEYLGHSGTKRFVDDTVPAGSGQVTYQVQAARSKSVGQKARYDISLGVTGKLPQTIIPQGRKKQIAA